MSTPRATCPAHGKYEKGCPDCPGYSSRYRTHRRRAIAFGTWSGTLWHGERLGGLRQHVRDLLATPGISAHVVADSAGVHRSVVYHLSRGETSSIHPALGEPLASLTVAECLRRVGHPDMKVDGTGTRRILQALAVDGWDSPTLAELCGLHRSDIERHRNGKWRLIRMRHRDAIRELYEKIQSQADPRGSSDRTRRYAKRNGYLPPECWADEDIDDPSAEPLPLPPETDDWVAVTNRIDAVLRDPMPGCGAGLERPLKQEVARHAYLRLGWSYQRIADVLGYRSENAVEYLIWGRKDRPHTASERKTR